MKTPRAMLGVLLLFCLACPDGTQQDPTVSEAQARYLRGVAALQEGRFGDAVLELEAGTALEPGMAQAHHRLGEAYIGVGRNEEAEASFRQALLLEPDKYLSHIGLGNSLNLQRRYDEALEAYRAAARLKPDLAEPHNLMGEVMERSGDDAGAADAFAEAARLTAPEEKAKPLARCASALASADRHDEAQDVYEKVVELVPEDEEAWLGLAEARVRTGALRGAADAYRRASKIDRDDLVTLHLLAAVHEVLGEVAIAKKVYARALRASPEDARTWEALARLHLSEGEREEAVHAAQKSLENLDGKDPELIRSVADLLAELDDAARSSELYRLLLQETDDDPALWAAFAGQLVALGKDEEAAAACRRLESLRSRNGEQAAYLEWCENNVSQSDR